MTGPGPGKIPLTARVFLEPPHIELKGVEVYLHVKGYSRARVTHLDIEHPRINDIIPPSGGEFLRIQAFNGGLKIKLRRVVRFDDRYVTEVRLLCSDINRVIGPGESSIAWVGGKEGGIYLGFRKKYVEALEEIARRRGYEPLSKAKT
ncbi:MAG: hypothetical protein J7L11_07700 [Thermoprotei archaeon]|nr:hypothetical protein [Thermoprotei archaeon]